MVATDGNRKFTANINNGTNYIAGGIFEDIQYYKHLQITVEEDDGNIVLSYYYEHFKTTSTQICHPHLKPTLSLLHWKASPFLL